MTQINILIFVTNVEQALKIVRVAEREYHPVVANSAEEIPGLVNNFDFWTIIIDSSYASFEKWKDLIKPHCSVIIVGREEVEIYQNFLTWPVEYHLDFILEKDHHPLEPILNLILKRAIHLSRIKREWAQLQQSLSLSSINTRQVFKEILEIKNLINENYLRELEKRVSIEARYVWFQKEREKIENIIRKIYSANDVSSLLGIVPDIKELLQAEGMTIYIIEDSEALGKHLKPIIWDDIFITHPETFKYVARLDSPDFAAAAARYGQEINICDLTYDKRLSPRYQQNLKTPLKSILAVPIPYGEEIVGVIELYNKSLQGIPLSEGFTKEDQQILRSLSEHIGISMTKLNLIQYDPLTGLLRGDPFFEKVLQKVNSLSKRKQEEDSFAMVMGDVDWFKNYNDRNGHEAGNRLLQELASVLKESVRDEDLICRYGGEEFLFFLNGVSGIDEACQLTDRIRKNIEDHYFIYEEFQPRNNLTMSFGVTVFPRKRLTTNEPLTKEDLKHLVHECDLALAEAKGKETWRLPTSEAKEKITNKNRVAAYYRDSERENQPRLATGYEDKLYREKRHFQRYYTSAILMYKEQEQLKVSKTINLSLGGAKILSEKPLLVSSPVEVIIVLGKMARSLQSEVVYSEKAGTDSQNYYTGLRFTNLTPEDLQLLESYFQETQKSPLH